jgi:hypothetical protein
MRTKATDERDRRIGRATRGIGKASAVASRVGYSDRRQRQINSGSPKGWPQDMAEIVAKLARDPALKPESLIVGLEEIVVDARQGSLDDAALDRAWLQACGTESRSDCRVDLLQLGLRTDPNDRRALQTIVEEAHKQATELLRLASLARVKLGRLA